MPRATFLNKVQDVRIGTSAVCFAAAVRVKSGSGAGAPGHASDRAKTYGDRSRAQHGTVRIDRCAGKLETILKVIPVHAFLPKCLTSSLTTFWDVRQQA